MINSNNKVKKTELVVQKKNKCENIYEFKHKDYDGVSRRLISGPLLTMMKNTYLIGDIEEGEGIEFIALEEPISCDFDFLVGSAISLDQNRQAVSFKVICRPIASGKEFEPWEDILDIKDPQAADAINIQTDSC